MNDKEFLKFNNKSINYADLKNKLADLNNAEKTQGNFNQVFSIFDQDGNGKLEESNKNGENELKNLWDALKKVATKNIMGTNDELDQTEIDKFSEEYLKTSSLETKNIVGSFVNFIFGIEKNNVELPSTEYQPQKIELTEKEAKNEIINTIMDDVNSAATLYYSQDNGKVSDLYDKLKEKDILGDKNLSATKVEEALALEEDGAKNLIEARDGNLSKKEYYLKNKEHLKTLLIRRLYEKDEKTGLDFLDSNRGSMSKKEFGKFLEDYIDSRINEIQSLDSIKTLQSELLKINSKETQSYLSALLMQAKQEKPLIFKGIEGNNSINNKIPIEFNSDEPISFEEVFKYERGCEYSKENVEYFLEKKQKMQVSVGAYNKYKVFENEVDKILKDYQNSLNINTGSNVTATGNEISFQEQEKKIISLYEAYYENPVDENLAKEKLKEIIKKANLPIQVKESEDGKFSLDLSAFQTNSEKNSALNGLLKFALQDQERILKGMLGGNVEEKMLSISQDYKVAHSSAFGDDFSEEIVKSMAEDNKTFIKKYTGEASTKGMILFGIGAALSLTPAAPLGGIMLGLGNTLALGGMVSESGLGLYEANTRDKKDEEEISDLTKTAIMNAGGFIVGFKAGKMGMKKFNEIIDKKLVAIFKEQMSSGNRLAALKEVFTNPEMLKNFATAAGAKLSTDFLISFAGDLIMMGILDPKEDWESLLKSNLMGVVVGTASDVADVGKLAGKKKTGVSNNEARVESEQNTKFLEGKINPDELTEVAPFARRLINSESSLLVEKEIKRIEQLLTDRMTNKTSEEEKLLVQNIINKITSENIDLLNSMLQDKQISNELIFNILNSCNKPYKISIAGLFNPVNIPIFLLQHTGFIGDIKINDKMKRNYAHKLILDNNIPKETIPGILQYLDKGNAELVDAALKTKDFNFNLLPAILKNTLIDSGYYINDQKSVFASRVKFAEKLINNPSIPNDCIQDILYYYGFENVSKKFAEHLCTNKDFPPQQISNLLGNISQTRKGTSYLFNTSEPKFKQKLAEKLVDDTNCPKEYIADIIGAIEKNQEKLFNGIYADENILKSEIASILWVDYALKKGYDKLDFSDKIAFLTNSVALDESTLTYLNKYNIDRTKVETLVDRISMEMGLKKGNMATTNEARKSLFKNFIANNSTIENSLNKTNLEKYSKGIPLKYPRSQFIKDIENILTDVSDEDKSLIFNYFNFSIENGKMEGFPIDSNKTPNLKKDLLPVIDKIKEKIVEFTQRNESKIDDVELNQIVNSIIQGCPEFITIVGKSQHQTHQYPVDVHTLKVLQNAFKNPEYSKLDDESKTVLKFAILLHDIGKKEGVIDNTHYETSAKYAVSILDRYNLPARIKSRIIETIYNHHWFEQYNKNEVSANLVNAIYRTPKDLQIAIIMAKADLAGVSNDFHFRITKTHREEEFNVSFDKKAEELFVQQDARYRNINLVMDTKFQQTNNRKFPTERISIDGKDYNIPVLNLTDETLPNDLYEFGFAKGITRKSARFLAHFNDKIKGLKVFMALSSSPTTESVQSLSLISLENSRAYKNQIYGVITDVDMSNIAQASNTNISSGYKKNLKTFAKDLFSFWQVNTYVKDNLINELLEAGISLSKDEYVQLSKEIVNIQYTTQVTRDVIIGEKIIPAKLLQRALDKSRDKLFEGSLHSEIVAINPRVKALVARVSSIQECSKEFLELAIENNLPIILIGHNE